MKQEIYLRAHTVTQTGKRKASSKTPSVSIWPERILVFDTETTIDARQELTFGVYWLCELKDEKYICSEEGLFHDDDLDERQLTVLKKYVETQSAQIEVKSFPPWLNLKLYPRWEFLEKVFWKALKNERMIVGFNLQFDLSRLAVDWAKADNGGWSLILSRRCSKQTGLWEPNPYRPRVRITAKDSKSAFISLTKPQKPDEWPPRSSDTPIWFAGPDLVASVLLTGKSPRIIKAIRMVPHGTQKGLNSISLYGTIDIDPHRDDFFRYVIEQRERNSSSNRGLAGFLKVLANSGSYGLFVEVTPETIQKPTAVKVFSGDTLFEQQGLSVENHGAWYFPPLASLITAGGRLLLAMLERSVSELNGTYLFCDTDSMCIVATEFGGPVACDGPEGANQVHTLAWKEVESICHRFRLLSPYDRSIVSDLLKIEDVNFNSNKRQRQLSGYAISAKRYALFERVGNDLNIIDPKAHGLGYLYPPADSGADNHDWTFAAWDWLLRNEFALPNIDPEWLDLPAMMRVRVSTPNVLRHHDKMLRPFNFVLCPLIDTLVGYPAGINRERFALLTSFTKNRDAWMKADCINIHDKSHHSLSFRQTPQFDKVIPQTFGYILRLYPLHPESKSFAPDGSPCTADTRGVLQRMHVTAMRARYIGKETDRKWEHGEDVSLLAFKPAEFDDLGKIAKAGHMLIEQLAASSIKAVARKANVDRNTIRKIMRGLPVRRGTLQRVRAALA